MTTLLLRRSTSLKEMGDQLLVHRIPAVLESKRRREKRLEDSRCSITNAEVFIPVDIEEEAQGEFSVAASSCSVQTVDIQSDIHNLETEALNLLAEDTYVDTLLTSLLG